MWYSKFCKHVTLFVGSKNFGTLIDGLFSTNNVNVPNGCISIYRSLSSPLKSLMSYNTYVFDNTCLHPDILIFSLLLLESFPLVKKEHFNTCYKVYNFMDFLGLFQKKILHMLFNTIDMNTWGKGGNTHQYINFILMDILLPNPFSIY